MKLNNVGMMKTETNIQERLRAVPSVQRVLEEPALQSASESLGRRALLAAVRAVLDEARGRLRAGKDTDLTDPKLAAVRAVSWAARVVGGGVRRVINATGVILHTGLGRAVLPRKALESIANELTAYCAVEMDLDSGKRGQRTTSVEALLRLILDCEAATVVNNNAAVTLLSLTALAKGKEVIVSRGQLVEIGGSFRIPDVMAQSGAKMVEVGTTNRTHLRDYENAITDETAVLLCVHTSNYRVIGFTKEVHVEDLARLAHDRGLLLVHDVGSGVLLPDLATELTGEPIVKESLEAGSDLVMFSGDKVIGGPQSGIAVGREAAVAKLRKHPLYRSFRCDKLILRALESTLALYLDDERRGEELPTLRMLRRPFAELESEANALAKALMEADPDATADTALDTSRLGSGSMPQGNIPTRVVRLRHARMAVERLAQALRQQPTPIITRIQDDRVLIDPRTLQAGETEEIVRAFEAIRG